MTDAPEATSRITPVESGLAFRPADFGSLSEALDYAAEGRTGFNYYNARGEVAEVLTYGEIRARADIAAARMLAMGLRAGDRVAVLAENDSHFADIFLGALRAGLIPAPVPLPAAFADRESYNDLLRRIVGVAGARAMFAPAEYADWAKEAMAPLALDFVGTVVDLPEVEGPAPHRVPDPEEIAYLQFSSGTTGTPKGVAVTHRSMMANLTAIARHGLRIGPKDRGVAWLPLYHDMGLVGCFFVPIATQMSADYFTTRDFVRRPLLWLELMSRNRCSISYAPSFGYDLVLRRARNRGPEEYDLSSWRIAGIGGDMIKAPTLRAFAEKFGPAGFDAGAFMPSYGMAETTLALSFAPLGQGLKTARLDLGRLERDMAAAAPEAGALARDFAYCGRPLPEHTVEIRDEDGALLPDGRVGRVFAAGPSLMKGYFGDEATTAAALSEGWLDTGDLGFMTEGQIVITGRAKDLMIVNGRNLWPQDIEWTVEAKVEAVRDGGAAVFSVLPDDSGAKLEEQVVVVVECRARDAEAREEIRRAVHAVVRETHGVEAQVALAPNSALPQTSSGKLSRMKTRAMFRDGAFDTGA